MYEGLIFAGREERRHGVQMSCQKNRGLPDRSHQVEAIGGDLLPTALPALLLEQCVQILSDLTLISGDRGNVDKFSR